ncbi:hypothetical protein [uncultured Eudoraea sp.]|uniref:hypothetical protein n=1 Tax=uncultured Eudoraea sp. TaxID=1035614 RepID=UPI0026093E21|nr:hypothetical protein [uncultured Eudoraea sp.]
MKTLSNIFFFVPLFAFVLFSCSDDDPEPLVKVGGPFEINELAGNWEATSATFSDGNLFVNIIEIGGSATMTVQSSGNFTLTIDPPDRPAYTTSGEMFWEEFEGQYYFAIEWANYPGDWDTYGATLNATTFTLNGGFDSGEYDFDNDGTFETASISFTFIRV